MRLSVLQFPQRIIPFPANIQTTRTDSTSSHSSVSRNANDLPLPIRYGRRSRSVHRSEPGRLDALAHYPDERTESQILPHDELRETFHSLYHIRIV